MGLGKEAGPTGLPVSFTMVDIGLVYPAAQGLGPDAFLSSDCLDCLRVGRVLAAVLTHEAGRALTERAIDSLWHDAILSTRKDAAPNLRRFKLWFKRQQLRWWQWLHHSTKAAADDAYTEADCHRTQELGNCPG